MNSLEAMKIIGKTQSVCPVCLKVSDAEKVYIPSVGVYLKKTCPDHGDFQTLIWEGDPESYEEWNVESSVVEPPVNGKPVEKGCPSDCGLCEEHQRKGCCMLLEVTDRCNLHCPVCFASAGSTKKEPALEEIGKQYEYLMSHGGPFNIQLSGGEPTMRDDLADIIRLGREKGFKFFQLNTNGIRIAEDLDYLKDLKKAGLCTVFLQFDGLTDDVYERLRGRKLLDLKMQAIENCKKAEMGVALVPVIAPGVNDHQIGDILQFGMDGMPFIRGVHFQPISYFGRNSETRPEKPITIPRMLSLIEEQTKGAMRREHFSGGGAENPYCSFHASFRLIEDGRVKALKKKGDCCCCSTTSDDSRQFVENQWTYELCQEFPQEELSETDALDEFLNFMHRTTFAVSGMLFQDAWNLDLERLKRCYICEMDPEKGMVPFCAYNLTDADGNYLYRR